MPILQGIRDKPAIRRSDDIEHVCPRQITSDGGVAFRGRRTGGRSRHSAPGRAGRRDTSR